MMSQPATTTVRAIHAAEACRKAGLSPLACP